MNKKGLAIFEMLIGVVFLLVLGIIAVIGVNTFNDLNTDLQADTQVNVQAKNTSQELYNDYPSTMDGAFVVFFGLLWILLLVASFYADTHPIFMILIIVVLAAVLVVAGFLSNSWEEFTDDSMITMESSFPMTNFLLDNLLVVFLAMGISAVLTMYVKGRLV